MNAVASAASRGEAAAARRRTAAALAAVVALGGVLRFATLDRQSFWLDELVTVDLLQLGLVDLLDAVATGERTPFLYYLLAKAWTTVFGDGEVGLRSLSALVGTATIPVAFAAGRALVSRRAGLVAAALVACNPLLVWYAQEARAYALLVLLTAGSLVFLGRALRDEPRAALPWAVTSSLAVATHYFAVFALLPQAALLLRRGRASALAVAAVGAVVLAHAPLAIAQADDLGGVGEGSLARRAAGAVKNAVVGFSFDAELAGTIVALALVLAGGLLAAVRTSGRARSGALVALLVAAAALLLPIGVALVGQDYVLTRNLIVVVVPAALFLGAGYATGRPGLAAAGALCALSVAIVVSVATDLRYGRTDWRGAIAALGEPSQARALVVTPSLRPRLLRPYADALREADGEVVACEVVVVALATESGFGAGAPEPPAGPPAPAPPGFELAGVTRTPTFVLVRYRIPSARSLAVDELERLRLTEASAVVVTGP